MKQASPFPGNRAFLVYLAAASLLVLAAAFPAHCREDSGGSTLVWGVHTRPTIINPILTSGSISASLVELIFNSLVRINSQGMIEPDLAYGWEVTPDGKEYTFHLRRGVYFHDGKELTSEDVLFTYQKVIDPEVHSRFAPYFSCVERFEAPDARTFKVYLKDREFFFLQRMKLQILPRHLLKNEDMAKTQFNFHPVGTGPFRLREWSPDGRIVLEANPGYYEGRPRLERIVIRPYEAVPQTWSALLRSEIDLAMFIMPEDAEFLKDDPAYRVYAYPGDLYCALFFNPDDPLLQDKNVRKAICMGIDRGELIAKAMGGYGRECYGPFSYEASEVYAGRRVTYDLTKARQMLAAAGWSEDADGILRDKDGTAMELRILADCRIDILKKVVMVLRQQLRVLGIRVYLVPFDDPSLLARDPSVPENMRKKNPVYWLNVPGVSEKEFVESRRPQAVVRAFYAGTVPALIEREWSSEVRRRNGDLWVYHNRELDRLFGQSKRAVCNLRPVCRKIQEILLDDCPAGFLFYYNEFHAVSADFTNTDGFFSRSMPIYLLKNWEKKERR